MHDLLRHLREVGLDGVPAVLGTDARGREILEYLPGSTPDPDEETVSDALLLDGARWLRRFHDAVRDFRPHGVQPWRNAARALAEDEIVCHHDPAAYNWAVEADRLVGVLDWDMAGPGRPVDDLAFVAWSNVPLYRPFPASDVARRLAVLADGYADDRIGPLTVLDAVVARMTAATERIGAGQDRGDPGMLRLAEVGEPARTRGRLARLDERIPQLRDLLADHGRGDRA